MKAIMSSYLILKYDKYIFNNKIFNAELINDKKEFGFLCLLTL